MKLAITGGTGFVGSRLLEVAVEQGHQISALTRRLQQPRPNIAWVQGSIEDRTALDRLAAGADAIIHVAGVISGRRESDFDPCNVEGTRAMLAAAQATGAKRFVHVSSLAAREPELSLYGGSKARSEQIVAGSSLDYAIVRPPAVYGPGDKETLELFKMASFGLVMLPPSGRLSLIHVDDLVGLLLRLAAPDTPPNLIIEPDDGRPGGWSHKEFAHALGEAVGKNVRTFSVPRTLLRLAARADESVRRGKAKLTRDRASYFSHPDWVADPRRAAPAALWRPHIATPFGLAATAKWYREQGWL